MITPGGAAATRPGAALSLSTARWGSLNSEYRAARRGGHLGAGRGERARGRVRRARLAAEPADATEWARPGRGPRRPRRRAPRHLPRSRLHVSDAGTAPESEQPDDTDRAHRASCRSTLGCDARPSPVPHPLRRRRDRRRRARRSRPVRCRRRRRQAVRSRLGRPAPEPTVRFQYAVASDPAARLPAIPFHGPWQAGIVNPPPPAACFVSFNVTATSRARADRPAADADRARTVPDRRAASRPDPGPVAPPSDSGTLGPEIPADGLTVTVGFGSTLFDDRFGIADRKPKHLTEMTSFPNDALNPDLYRRRPAAADLRRPPRHGDPRAAGHRQAHPRRHADPVADGRLRLAGAARRRPAQPLRLHGRRSPTRTSPIRRSPTDCCGWSRGSASPTGRSAAATTSAGSSGCSSSSGTGCR